MTPLIARCVLIGDMLGKEKKGREERRKKERRRKLSKKIAKTLSRSFRQTSVEIEWGDATRKFGLNFLPFNGCSNRTLSYSLQFLSNFVSPNPFSTSLSNFSPLPLLQPQLPREYSSLLILTFTQPCTLNSERR